jgi:predicted protein tyrosine phosphatase
LNVYDDPVALAQILESAALAAEEHEETGMRVGTEVLHAAARLLRASPQEREERLRKVLNDIANEADEWMLADVTAFRRIRDLAREVAG